VGWKPSPQHAHPEEFADGVHHAHRPSSSQQHQPKQFPQLVDHAVRQAESLHSKQNYEIHDVSPQNS